jgi:predicted 3-demethylubiquinone-9 3-methyltransferase (glyoxalase superfamily)
MPKITPYLTFKDRGFEAVNFYLSLFKNSKLNYFMRDGDKLLFADFDLDGQHLSAMDGGPEFNFDLGISLMVDCTTQEEIDLFWEKLSDGGEPGQCGWLKDKYGLSWQIVPVAVMGQLLRDKDTDKSKRVMDAMLTMGKLDISALKKAFNQG